MEGLSIFLVSRFDEWMSNCVCVDCDDSLDLVLFLSIVIHWFILFFTLSGLILLFVLSYFCFFPKTNFFIQCVSIVVDLQNLRENTQVVNCCFNNKLTHWWLMHSSNTILFYIFLHIYYTHALRHSHHHSQNTDSK